MRFLGNEQTIDDGHVDRLRNRDRGRCKFLHPYPSLYYKEFAGRICFDVYARD